MTKTQKVILNHMAEGWILSRPTPKDSEGWIQEIGKSTKIAVSISTFKAIRPFVRIEGITSKSIAKYTLI